MSKASWAKPAKADESVFRQPDLREEGYAAFTPEEIAKASEFLGRGILARASIAERLEGIPLSEILRRIAPNEVIKLYSVEQRLQGLTIEECLSGIPLEEILAFDKSIAEALGPEALLSLAPPKL